MLKKATHNSNEDVPDVRADKPDGTMERFADGLRRVLSTKKLPRGERKHPRRQKASKA